MGNQSNIAFHPLGDTITVAAATTPPAGQQAPIRESSGTSAGQYRVINDSTVLVFLGVGSTSASAIARAGSAATSIPLLPGACEIIRFSPNSFFTCRTASGTANVYITPGQGI